NSDAFARDFFMIRRRWICVPLCLSAALLWSLASAAPGPSENRGATVAATDQGPPPLLREGEIIEVVGKLELAGDRATFTPQNSDVSLRVLENLALQRVIQVL